MEPVVVVDEARDAVLSGQVGLGRPHIGIPEVVVAQLAWDMGLVVPGIERAGRGHVRPLGEALAPPFVVLGDRVELG